MGQSENTQGSKHVNPPPDNIAARQTKPAFGGSWLPFTSFSFLIVNSVFSIYRSRNDPASVAFIVTAFLDLLLLFVCVRRLEAAPPTNSSSGRTPLKVAVWLLSSLFIFLFASRVAPLMLPVVAVVVWGMAAGTASVGFFMLFVYRERPAPFVAADDEKPLRVEGA